MSLSLNMNNSVVPGEAPESDDEVQDEEPTVSIGPSSRSVVSGEAPESSSSSVSSECQDSCQERGQTPDISDQVKTSSLPTSPTMDVREKVLRSIRAQRKESLPSLLYTKLRENNVSLRTSLTDFARRIGQQTSKDLNAIDNYLLRSQVTLQEAVTAFRKLSKNVTDINAALGLSPSLNGIPQINIRTVL